MRITVADAQRGVLLYECCFGRYVNQLTAMRIVAGMWAHIGRPQVRVRVSGTARKRG